MDYLDALVALLVHCLLGQAAPATIEASLGSEAGFEARPAQAPRLSEGFALCHGAEAGWGTAPAGRCVTPARVALCAGFAGGTAVRSTLAIQY
jgi:hypothetical protein